MFLVFFVVELGGSVDGGALPKRRYAELSVVPMLARKGLAVFQERTTAHSGVAKRLRAWQKGDVTALAARVS